MYWMPALSWCWWCYCWWCSQLNFFFFLFQFIFRHQNKNRLKLLSINNISIKNFMHLTLFLKIYFIQISTQSLQFNEMRFISWFTKAFTSSTWNHMNGSFWMNRKNSGFSFFFFMMTIGTWIISGDFWFERIVKIFSNILVFFLFLQISFMLARICYTINSLVLYPNFVKKLGCLVL